MKANGRPKGAIAQVLQSKEFGLDQFAAVKAFLLGIDPLIAAKRYLLTDDVPQNSEAAIRRIAKLMRKIATIGGSRRHGADEVENARNVTSAAALNTVVSECMAATKNIRKLRADLSKAKAEKHREIALKLGLEMVKKSMLPKRPERFKTLRDFDDWYEDTYRPEFMLDPIELKSQYEDHLYNWYANQGFYYVPDYSIATSSTSEVAKVSATNIHEEPTIVFCSESTRRAGAIVIDHLQWTVQRSPSASDELSAWIGGTTLKALESAKIATLYGLCELISNRGARWWAAVPSLGPVRAARIQEWIKEVGIQGVYMRSDAFEPIQRRRLREILSNERQRPALPALKKVMLEPLSDYVDNKALNGINGIFRTTGPNMLNAETDIDALVVALGKYESKRPTLKVYAREICRFCLWAYKELKLPISSISIVEAGKYREFLDQIPPDWISASASPPPRNTHEWRPFRGQLDAGSKRKALTSINVVFSILHTQGFLIGNPISGVLKHSALPSPTMDTARSLSLDQWNFACQVLDELMEAPEGETKNPIRGHTGPSLRRLKAMLHLMFETGVRRDELFKARLGDVTRIVVDGQATHMLKVTGKRTRVREIPIDPEIMQLVMAHVADRSEDFQDNLSSKSGRALIPLISVLQRPVKTYKRENSLDLDATHVETGIEMAEQTLANRDGALSPDGMQTQLQRFFAKCASLASEHGIDREAFDMATLHWMRHTFGHTNVDNNVDLRVVQKAMGHVDINMTARYSKADRDQMVRGLREGKRSIQRASLGLVGSAPPVALLQDTNNSSDGET